MKLMRSRANDPHRRRESREVGQKPPKQPMSGTSNVQPASILRSERFLYLVSSSLGLTGLPTHCLLRLDFEWERRRRDGDEDGFVSRQGEWEREDAGWDVKREKEANALERKGKGVVGLDIGLMYRDCSCWGMGRPGGDDVAFECIEEDIGAQSSGGLVKPSDSSDSEEDDRSGTSGGIGCEYALELVEARGVSSSSSSSAAPNGICTRTARGWRCLPVLLPPSGLPSYALAFVGERAASSPGR